MNILHISHTDIRVDSRILKEMHSIGKTNSSYSVSGIGIISSKNENELESPDGVSIDSITIQSTKLKFLPKIRVIFMMLEMLFKMTFRAYKVKAKIVHCHDNIVLPVGAILKLLTGAKVIYDAHELESDRNGLKKILAKMTLFTEKFLWKYIDALITVSPSIDRWYMQNIGEKYSEIILNSPILEQSTSSRNHSYLRECFSIPKESRIFLYVGALVHGRGIGLLLEAFKNRGLKSSLVFLGNGLLSDELKKIADETANIYIHNVVPHEQVVSVAKSADVGLCLIQNVSLSDYYCLPNKLFEYCFAEIPVLASNFPDISQVVERYNLGKCSELEVGSIYKTIKEFENLEELPKIDSTELYELSWGAQEEKLIRLYGRVINKI